MNIFQNPRYQNTFLLALLMAASLYLNFSGLRFGLPGREQSELLFPDRQVLSDIAPAMLELREKVFEEYARQDSLELLKYFAPGGGTMRVTIRGVEKEVPQHVLHTLRGGLLQSQQVDEQIVISALTRINPAQGKFNPHLYQYGGFYLYTAGVALKLADLAGAVRLTSDLAYYFDHPGEIAKIYMIVKMVGGAFAALGIPAIFVLCRRLYGRRTGLLAAVFYAMTPAIMLEAHILKPYAFFIPLALLALLYSYETATDMTGNRRYPFFAGIFAGLSAGSMSMSGIIVLAALYAAIFPERRQEAGRRGMNAAFVVLGAAAGFFLTNFYWLSSFPEAMKEYRHLTVNAPFHPALHKVVRHFFTELPKLFGAPLYVFCIAGAALALWRRDTASRLILVVLLPFYFYTSATHYFCAHYAMPLVPLMLVLAARFAGWLGEVARPKSLYVTVLVLLITYTSGYSLFYARDVFNGRAHFFAAGRWINESLPKGAAVAMDTSLPLGVFPAFDLLDHPPVNGGPADYYLQVSNPLHPLSSDGAPPAGCRLVREFRPESSFLGKIYRNRYMELREWDVRVYKRES